MLNLFKYSWKQIVTLGIILICFSALAWCLFKVTYALLAKPISTVSGSQWTSKNSSKKFEPKTTMVKGMFFLTMNDFMPSSAQVNLVEGNYYFITKTISANQNEAQCLYGIFQLVKKNPHQFNFKVFNYFSGKKFEQYALTLSKNIKYSILEQSQLPTKILNCKNWLSVHNTYNISANNPQHIDETHSVLFSKPKCTIMPSANLIVVQSDSPQIVYFDYNHTQNKLYMCVKQTGHAIVRMMTLNSGKFQTHYFHVNKKIETRNLTVKSHKRITQFRTQAIKY